MKGDEADLDAGEYVLGTLDDASRRRFAAALADNPALQALVEGWEQRLGALEGGTAPHEPTPELWEKIEGALDQAPGDNVTVRGGEGRWEVIAEGVEKKSLFFDPDAGTESFLLRLAPGTRLPVHHHVMVEECLVIDGDFTIGDERLVAGDYHVAKAGSEHPEAWTVGGNVLYIRGERHEHAA